MLELLLCSTLTVLPDFLYRRFGQGKRLGREITLFSVWYELRWGITGCVILTLTLITLVFFFHPSTTAAASFFRTVPVLPERIGRVEEIYVGLMGQEIEAGAPIFRLDASDQEATAESARRRIAEAEAAIAVAATELLTADARIAEAESAYEQAQEEYETRAEIFARNPNAVPERDVERARINAEGRASALEAARAGKVSLEAQVETLLPAQKASAEAALAEAEVDIAKSVIVAGVTGRLEQFTLRVGDVVNPMMRPAGILVPREAGRVAIQAGFGQLEAQVIRPGMIGEATCPSLAWTIIPLVVTEVQPVIAAGQVRPSDQLLDPAAVVAPGTVTVTLQALFEGGLDRLPPGSSCIVNAYTSNHDRLDDPDVGGLQRLGLHAIDAIGLVHAMILRMQAIVLPVRTLVLGGH